MERSDDFWFPETLVLGPGGMRGYLQLGALLYLEKNNYLNNIKRVVGCSIGALIGLFFVIGFNILDLILMDFKFKFFEQTLLSSINEIQRLVGLTNHKKFKEEINDKILKMLGVIPTLEGLYKYTMIEFYVCTYNLTKNRIEYISHHTHPDMSCVDAVILSSNVPFIFQELTMNGDTYIDGALANPYPIEEFDDEKNDILGIIIRDDDEHQLESNDLNKIGIYMTKVSKVGMIELEKRIIDKCSNRCKHLIIKTNIIDPFGITYDINDIDTRFTMVAKGSSVAENFVYELIDKNFLKSRSDKKFSNDDVRDIAETEENLQKIVVEGNIYYKDPDVIDQEECEITKIEELEIDEKKVIEEVRKNKEEIENESKSKISSRILMVSMTPRIKDIINMENFPINTQHPS